MYYYSIWSHVGVLSDVCQAVLYYHRWLSYLGPWLMSKVEMKLEEKLSSKKRGLTLIKFLDTCICLCRNEAQMILYEELNCPSSWLSGHLKCLYPVTLQTSVSGHCNTIQATSILLWHVVWPVGVTIPTAGFQTVPRGMVSEERYVLQIILE